MIQPLPGPLTGAIRGNSSVEAGRSQTDIGKPEGTPSDFMQTLRGAMSEVERLHADGQQKIAELLRGDGQDIHGAMIAVEKANMSFELMVQVRNKIVQAYQEISRMPF